MKDKKTETAPAVAQPSQVAVSFAAIDPYIEQNILEPTEKEIKGKDLVEWGERNLYPEYLLELYKTTPTLRSVINGRADFIVGDGQTILPLPGTQYASGVMNTRGDTIRQQVDALAHDDGIYGGFALQVIRGLGGEVVEIYHCDLRYLRSNKENTVFYYSEKWAKSGAKKVSVYPAFQHIAPEKWATLTPEEKEAVATSILYVKNTTTQTYPLPVYCAAVKDCEIERGIDDFHLNSINNEFQPSAIVNFNNGVPSDEIKKEIAKDMKNKFGGHSNGRRFMLVFNTSKANATTFEYPDVKDFGARYDALSKHCRQQIFTAFRANPNLFGIPTENLGFSQEEYDSAFRLYNRTCIRPVQRVICDAYDKIYEQPGVLTIQPFTIDGAAVEKSVN